MSKLWLHCYNISAFTSSIFGWPHLPLTSDVLFGWSLSTYTSRGRGFLVDGHIADRGKGGSKMPKNFVHSKMNVLSTYTARGLESNSIYMESIPISIPIVFTAYVNGNINVNFLKSYWQWQCQYQFFPKPTTMAISIAIVLKLNINGNGNTNFYSNQYQWQYQ